MSDGRRPAFAAERSTVSAPSSGAGSAPVSGAASAPRASAPRSNKAPRPERDMAPSSFTMILERLVVSTPSARGAALVDFEGETVDYAGGLDPYEMKIAAATWQIVLAEIGETALETPRQIVVRAARTSYVLRRVNKEYAIGPVKLVAVQ